MVTDTWPVPELERPLDWDQLRRGQQVVVRRGPVVLHRGTVEKTGAYLGLVWIRDTGTGLPRMLSRHDVTLYPEPADVARGRTGATPPVTGPQH